MEAPTIYLGRARMHAGEGQGADRRGWRRRAVGARASTLQLSCSMLRGQGCAALMQQMHSARVEMSKMDALF
jgi:hypothetical protein